MAEDEKLKPPYVAWRTFETFVDELRARGAAPQVIDNTVFGGNRSGAARSELRVALRFLHFIDSDGRPTDAFVRMIEGSEDDKRATLRATVITRYESIVGVGLENATERQVEEGLAKLGGGGSTLRKSLVFFLRAAEASQIPLGPFLMKVLGAPVAGGTNGTKRRSTKRKDSAPKTTPAVLSQGETVRVKLPTGTVTLNVDVRFTSLESDARLKLFELIDALRALPGAEIEN